MANSRKNPRLELWRRVGQRLTHLLPLSPDTHLCVGFSGGLDSVVLLHLLAVLREQHGFKLSALHVHHGLSPNADSWADFARETTAAWGVSCQIFPVTVAQHSGLGLEGAARRARYAAFEQLACDAILLAHHRDDQAETVLLNLMRGSGLSGLAAMPQSRKLGNGVLLARPLLDEPRRALQDYACAHSLRWVEDESNADTTYDRNFLRHRILPELESVFPGASKTLFRVAAHSAEGAELLAELAEMDLVCCVSQGGFDLAHAARLSIARKRNVLRHWLAREHLVLDSRAFDDLLGTMENARVDAEPVFVWRDRTVRRYRGRLFVTPAQLQPGPTISVSWQNGNPISVPEWHGQLHWQRVEQGGIAEAFLQSAQMELRPRAGGERLRLQRSGANRLIKHLWQEAGIKPWCRDTTPLIWLNGQLVAVPGLGVADAFAGAGWKVNWCVD